MLVDLLDGATVDDFFDGFAEVAGKLDVFVLHRESRLDQVVEAKILLEATVKLCALELLEEKDEQL